MVCLSGKDMGWSPYPGFESSPCHLLATLNLTEHSVSTLVRFTGVPCKPLVK